MMKKIYCYFFFLFILLSTEGIAQPFQRMYGGVNQEISLVALPSPSGGIYYIGATTSSGSGEADIALLRLNDDGDLLWAKTHGGPYLDVAGAMVFAGDGGLACAGSTKSYNGNTPDDLYFFKVDSMGDLLWAKTFVAGDLSVASAIVKTSDDGFAITGFSDFGTDRQVLLIRTDANGDTLFTKFYGSTASDQGVELYEMTDGGLMITGKTQTQTLGESDILMMRTDALGNLLWAKSFGDTLWDEGAGIIQLADGNMLISGSTISYGQGDFDILLLKMDTTGTLIWGRTYGADETDAGYTARENPDGSILISGYSSSLGYGHNQRMANPSYMMGGDRGDDSTNIFLMKVDADGDTLWTRTYGDGAQDEAFHFYHMPDGGYLMPGFTKSYTGNTDSTQMMLVRTDSLGHSGCHEQDAYPILDTTNFITQTLPFIESSGFIVNTVTPTILLWNEAAEDACLYIGFAEQDEDAYSIYPNPAAGMINIEHAYATVEELEWIDMLGASVQSKNFTNPSSKFTTDVSDFAPGIYFLKLTSSGSQVIKKIIIQKH